MGCVRLWAFTWGLIISAARDEMKLVHDPPATASVHVDFGNWLI